MASAIIKVLIGLFIWMVLPRLIFKKRKYKKNTTQFFTVISCKIVGGVIIIFAVVGLIQLLFDF